MWFLFTTGSFLQLILCKHFIVLHFIYVNTTPMNARLAMEANGFCSENLSSMYTAKHQLYQTVFQ